MNGRTLAAELIMMRAADSRTFLVVEGSTDRKLFASFVDEAECEVFWSGCRDYSLEALTITRSLNMLGILCVVDRDYDDFINRPLHDPDVIVTQDHDIEITMIKSTALDKLMRELGSESKIAKLAAGGRTPRDIVLDAAHPYGMLRLYSLERGLSFRFEDLRFRSIDQYFSAPHEAVARELVDHSNMQGHDHCAMVDHMAKWSTTAHDRWQMCCGHDLTALIGRGLRSLFGTQRNTNVQPEEIESRLRLAFGAEEFVETALYDQIKDWEQRRKPYRVLRI
jgi:hypothetical protein